MCIVCVSFDFKVPKCHRKRECKQSRAGLTSLGECDAALLYACVVCASFERQCYRNRVCKQSRAGLTSLGECDTALLNHVCCLKDSAWEGKGAAAKQGGP